MSVIITVPTGRGKLSRSAKPWAKTVTSVAKNAQSGRDWDGEWLTQGQDAEVDLGDMIVVSDLDGEGASLYVAAEIVRWCDVGPKIEAEFFRMKYDGGKRWAAEMSVEARKLLAMDVEERLTAVATQRRNELANGETAANAGETYKFGKTDIPGPEAVTRFRAMLNFVATPA